MRVLFITAELSPLAKVGGLADVAGALPKALADLKTDVRVVLPLYSTIDQGRYPTTIVAKNVVVPFNGTDEHITIHQTTIPGSTVPVYLIEHPRYLGEGGVYFDDTTEGDKVRLEAERFLFFSRASLAIPSAVDFTPDIIHCQDWHVGMVPVLKDILGKKDTHITEAKTLLTIHNLEYQGWYQQSTVLQLLDLSVEDHPALANTKEGQLISLRQGILTADFINTVSETYAGEILTPEYGAQLEVDLQSRKADLLGILNGIDVERFDPQTDPDIPEHFSENNPAGKAACKAALQKECGLPVKAGVPVIGIVTRLAQQKGVDLVADSIEHMVAAGAQFVLLGTGLQKLEQLIAEKATAHPASVCAMIKFDAAVAQHIYAGSDMFLMPSRYEPCGLGQMIAMRYGTVPIVRATGGLKDTVHEVGPDGADGEGFVFSEYSAVAFQEAITRALKLYQNQKSWHTIVRRIMQQDFSWTASAKKYLAIYAQLIT